MRTSSGRVRVSHLVFRIAKHLWWLDLSSTPGGVLVPPSYRWHQLIPTAKTALMALPVGSKVEEGLQHTYVSRQPNMISFLGTQGLGSAYSAFIMHT